MAQEAIRDVVLRVRMEYTNTAPKVNTDPAKKAMSDLGKTAQSAMDKAEAAANKANQISLKAAQSSLKLGEHMVRAADGALVLARGIAFLSSSSDEDFQAVLQNILVVQGALDSFRGGVAVISEVVKALHAYKAASAAAAAASTAAAAADTAKATAAVAAGAASSKAVGGLGSAVAALGVSTGGLALLVAGLAAVGVWAYNGLIAGPRKAKEESDKLNKSMEETARRLSDIGLESHKAAQEQKLSATTDRIDAQAKGGRNPADTRAALFDEFRASQQRTADLQVDADAYGKNGLLEKQKAALEEITAEREHQRAIAERINDTYKEDIAALNDQLGKLEQIRDAAKSAVDEEQKRIQMRAEIGRLTATERAELEQIAQIRNSGGQLTDAQLKRAGELAPSVAGEFVKREQANKAGDTSNIEKGFAVEKTEAEKILAESQKAVDDMKKQIADSGQIVADRVREGWEAIVDILDQLVPVKEKIEQLRRDLAIRDAQGQK